ncbi:NlpC/P60 family protein [Streptomyces spinoverrucosus]|uniref:NlpC/P60 family protein n=1 Tax=Streptomyces spinoverrucosus TaxID=284043 RepID=UPI0011411AFD|nr:NlpC/P60 family protein [Streptomyces spinoverrucosus]
MERAVVVTGASAVLPLLAALPSHAAEKSQTAAATTVSQQRAASAAPAPASAAEQSAPSHQQVTHEVTAGDTLSGIGEEHDVHWQDVCEANDHKIEDCRLIYPGQEFVIPKVNAKVAATQPRSSDSASSRTVAAAPAPAPAPAPAAASSPAQQAVDFALQQLGKPYIWGATGPHSYDCSGLIQAAYGHADVNIPRVTTKQARAGTPVALSQLRPGDLVLFSHRSHNDHVGLYIGNGKMIHAPKSNDVVKISDIHSQGATPHGVRVA